MKYLKYNLTSFDNEGKRSEELLNSYEELIKKFKSLFGKRHINRAFIGVDLYNKNQWVEVQELAVTCNNLYGKQELSYNAFPKEDATRHLIGVFKAYHEYPTKDKKEVFNDFLIGKISSPRELETISLEVYGCQVAKATELTKFLNNSFLIECMVEVHQIQKETIVQKVKELLEYLQ